MSFARTILGRPAATAPRPRAIRTFRFSFRRFASFLVIRRPTTAVHASSQVTLTGMRPRFSAFARLRELRRTVPLGGGSADTTPEGPESDETVRPRVAVTRTRRRRPTSASVGE